MLFAEGALEVYTVPVGMKKSRPGHLISVVCETADREKILSAIFKHTTTLGVRENIAKRYILKRRVETRETEYGEIREKISMGYGVERRKYEYEDLAKIAKEKDLTLRDVRNMIK